MLSLLLSESHILQANPDTNLGDGDPAGEPPGLHVDKPGVLQRVAAQGEALSGEHGVGPHLQAGQTQVAVP